MSDLLATQGTTIGHRAWEYLTQQVGSRPRWGPLWRTGSCKVPRLGDELVVVNMTTDNMTPLHHADRQNVAEKSFIIELSYKP